MNPPSAPEPRLSCPADYEAWLSLAAEVEHLFGPMAREASFQAGLREAIAEHRAFCVDAAASQGCLAGGVVISHPGNRVEWLAVSGRARGRGLGASLLRMAISRLDPDRSVTVQTFSSSSGEGLPARNLYRKFGFTDGEPCEPTPTGVPTILMVRPRAPGQDPTEKLRP